MASTQHSRNWEKLTHQEQRHVLCCWSSWFCHWGKKHWNIQEHVKTLQHQVSGRKTWTYPVQDTDRPDWEQVCLSNWCEKLNSSLCSAISSPRNWLKRLQHQASRNDCCKMLLWVVNSEKCCVFYCQCVVIFEAEAFGCLVLGVRRWGQNDTVVQLIPLALAPAKEQSTVADLHHLSVESEIDWIVEPADVCILS